jgi:hypothetical protein
MPEGEHFTKNTVEAACWCQVCRQQTMHRIDDGIRGPCLVCLEKRTVPSRKPPEKIHHQEQLFK